MLEYVLTAAFCVGILAPGQLDCNVIPFSWHQLDALGQSSGFSVPFQPEKDYIIQHNKTKVYIINTAYNRQS